MPLIKDPAVKRVKLHGHEVRVKSLRLKNFAKSHACCDCGLVATHFAVEENGSEWHINLWAERPGMKEMLFTHDHTLARSLGGADTEENTTTMCAKCNHKKAVGEFAEYCKLKGLPPPGTKKKPPKPKGVSNKEQLCTIEMELAVRQFRKREAKAAA
jgi:cytochrome c553